MEAEGKNVIVTLSIGANSTITLAKWANVAVDFGKLNVEADRDSIRFRSLRCYGFTRRSPNTFALVKIKLM